MATPLPSNPWMEHAAARSKVCIRCNDDRFISGAYPDLPDEPCPVCNSGALSGAERVRAAAAALPEVVISTVGDYIGAHDLHVVIAIEGFLDLPIAAVAVEHDEEAQMSYFTQQGSQIGSAAWSQPEQT